MYHRPDKKWEWRLVNALFVALFLAAIGLLQWLSQQYHLRIDLTGTGRHTLAPASVAAVERLAGPLTVTLYASERSEARRVVRELVERYRRHKPDITLEIVDPDTAPERVREAGVRHDGEVVLRYGEAREQLQPTRLDEETFTNALTRLGHRGERWVVFVTGHGERSPDRQANFDLSVFAAQLRSRGFKTRTLALAEIPQVPRNTAVLVIAGPRTRWLPGELKAVEAYLDEGGSLMWLHDPGPLHGLERLAERLGVEFLPGVIVDPASQTLTGNPTAVVIASYGNHPVVRGFTDVTLFPHTAAMRFKPPAGWEGRGFIDTRADAWVETGPLEGRIAFDKGRDIRGPVTLAVALSRQLDNPSSTDGGQVAAAAKAKASAAPARREQRVAVLGDGDFLSNTFLGNGGNLDLGLSLMNWLAQDDAYVSIPVKVAHDRELKLSRAAQIAIGAGFLVMLPLVLAGAGVAVWLRRRRR